MPHVVFVPFTGFRVREDEMRELGMSLPGFKQRAAAIAELPALGLLTLAGMTPDSWTCRHRGAPSVDEGLIEQILVEQPALRIDDERLYAIVAKFEAVLVIIAGVPLQDSCRHPWERTAFRPDEGLGSSSPSLRPN